MGVGEDSGNGYYGVAFRNEVTKEIVIAHRGTNFPSEDVLQFDAIWPGLYASQFISAVKFTERVQSENHGYRIAAQTGHSLGGALANFASLVNENRSVVFDAPGIGELLTHSFWDRIGGLVSNVRAQLLEYVDKALSNIRESNADKNLINVFPTEDRVHTFGLHRYDGTRKGIGDMLPPELETGLYAGVLGNGHSLTLLINALMEKVGGDASKYYVNKTPQVTNGTMSNDALIEQLFIGSNVIYGNGGDDTIAGNIGNDLLVGGVNGAHGNLIFGGYGDDTLRGGYSADTLIGGVGIDTADYLYRTDMGMVVVLGENGVAGYSREDVSGSQNARDRDYLESIENISGSNQNDALTGNSKNNVLEGRDGTDALDGLGGDDLLMGGSGDDYLYGGDGNDPLEGGTGKDRLYGYDAVEGKPGKDYASYAHAASGITVNLGTGTGSRGEADGDTIVRINNIIGSDYGDEIYGSESANELKGLGGNDTLIGGKGSDVLMGGSGSDTYKFFTPDFERDDPKKEVIDTIQDDDHSGKIYFNNQLIQGIAKANPNGKGYNLIQDENNDGIRDAGGYNLHVDVKTVKVKNEAGKTFNRIDLDVDTGDGHIIIQNYKKGGFGINIQRLNLEKDAAQIDAAKQSALAKVNLPDLSLPELLNVRFDLPVGFQKEWALTGLNMPMDFYPLASLFHTSLENLKNNLKLQITNGPELKIAWLLPDFGPLPKLDSPEFKAICTELSKFTNTLLSGDINLDKNIVNQVVVNYVFQHGQEPSVSFREYRNIDVSKLLGTPDPAHDPFYVVRDAVQPTISFVQEGATKVVGGLISPIIDFVDTQLDIQGNLSGFLESQLGKKLSDLGKYLNDSPVLRDIALELISQLRSGHVDINALLGDTWDAQKSQLLKGVIEDGLKQVGLSDLAHSVGDTGYLAILNTIVKWGNGEIRGDGESLADAFVSTVASGIAQKIGADIGLAIGSTLGGPIGAAIGTVVGAFLGAVIVGPIGQYIEEATRAFQEAFTDVFREFSHLNIVGVINEVWDFITDMGTALGHFFENLYQGWLSLFGATNAPDPQVAYSIQPGLAGGVISIQDIETLDGMTSDKAKALWQHLIELHYVEPSGRVNTSYKFKSLNFQLGLSAEYATHLPAILFLLQNAESHTGDIMAVTNRAYTRGGDLDEEWGYGVIASQSQDDILIGAHMADRLIGRDGNNVLLGQEGEDILDGGAGNDTLVGGLGDDVLFGGTGDDLLSGDDGDASGRGSDLLVGGAGQDTLFGGVGQDILVGASGNDMLLGDEDNDELYGGIGNDSLYGGNGDDSLSGGDGVDIISGGTGRDMASGGTGDDYLDGGDGADLLSGNVGDDYVIGGAGNDLLFGGMGDDVLSGGDGNDTLVGGIGNDSMTGGADKDYFVITQSADTMQVITDFDAREDVLDLSTFVELKNWDSLSIFMISSGIEIDLGHGQSLILENVGISQLRRENFIFGLLESLYPGDLTEVLATVDQGGNILDETSQFASYVMNGYWQRYESTHWVPWPVHVVEFYNYIQEQNLSYGGQNITAPQQVFGNERANLIVGSTNTKNYIYASAGDDTAIGGVEADFLVGGSGNDSLEGQEGNDILYGNSGNDSLIGAYGDDILSGGDGDDLLSSWHGNDTLEGNDGNDSLYGGPGIDVLSGGSGNDILNGEEDADFLSGDVGNDSLFGCGGNDILYGGDGEDGLYGGDNNDVLLGDAGNDTLYGENGSDNLYGNLGNDNLFGGSGMDTLSGGDGDDGLYGHFDADYLQGGAGNDTLYGEFGNDTLLGNDGNDLLRGYENNDSLEGGAGNDTLIGSSGTDVLIGGDGGDVFIIDRIIADVDEISDFDVTNASEKIDLSAFTEYSSFEDLTIRYQGTRAIIELPNYQRLNLTGIVEGQVNGSHFIGKINTTTSGVEIGTWTASSALTANMRFATTVEDQSVTLDVLAQIGGIGSNMTPSIAKVTEAQKGRVSVINNKIIYTPNQNANGSDTFAYTVRDGHGRIITQTLDITIKAVNDAPTVNLVGGTTIEDKSITLDVLSQASDIDGDTLSISAITQGQKGAVSVVNDKLVYTPNANMNGSDTVAYTISDGHGGVVTRTLGVTIAAVNDAPTAGLASTTTIEDQSITLDVLSQVSDVDGDTSFTISDITQGQKGTISIVNNKIIYTSKANANGKDTFTYTISDSHGASVIKAVDVDITAVNDAPAASLATATTSEDASVILDVLSQASDIDGDTIVIFGITQGQKGSVSVTNNKIVYSPMTNANGDDTFTYTLSDGHGGIITKTANVTINAVNDAPVAGLGAAVTIEDRSVILDVLAQASDVDGDNVTIAGVGQGQKGVVSIVNNKVVYIPNANVNGNDSFTYTLIDGHGGTTIRTINMSITPENDPLSANLTAAGTIEDTAVILDVLSQASDIDGDTLSIFGITQGEKGVVSIANNKIIYTPAANKNGNDTFTYTISDGHGATVTKTVSVEVTPINDAPTATLVTAEAIEDGSVILNVLSQATDIDGDVLSISGITQGNKGVVSIVDNNVIYTPNPNVNGADTFTYEIIDRHGGTISKTVNVNITAVNDIPTATLVNAVTAEDASVILNVLSQASDVDGDTLSISQVTQGQKGSVSIVNNQVVYTPNADATRNDSFTYTLSDNHGGTITKTVGVTITAVNDTPTANLVTATTIEDGSVRLNVLSQAADVDGDSLSISDITQGTKGSVTIVDNKVVYTPNVNTNGVDAFTYTISDGHGGTITKTVDVGITAVNDAPVVGTLNNQTVVGGDHFNIALGSAFNDADGDALSYSIAQSGGTALPSWLQYDAPTKSLSGTAPVAFSGLLNLVIQASDGHGGTASANFGFQVNSPIITSDLRSGISVTQDRDVNVTYMGGSAGYHNSLGYYRIDAAGRIHDTQMVFIDQHAVRIGTDLRLGTLAAGDAIGFFILANGYSGVFSDGAGRQITLSQAQADNGAFSFVENGTAGSTFRYTSINGTVYTYTKEIYHSIQNGMAQNPDGINHVIMDLDSNGQGVNLWFEDLLGGGDRDFNDLMVHVDLEIGGYSTGYDQKIEGWNTSESLAGTHGNDTIRGWHGNDTIDGGAGKDSLTGGNGVDTFVFSSLTDSSINQCDIILDFADGQDKIDLRGLGFAGFEIGNGHGTILGVHYDQGNTIIDDPNTVFAITLQGHHSLATADFIFS